MPVIAIINQKGGVGKTCLATNLASALRSQGPVLLLDCDPFTVTRAPPRKWCYGA